MQWKLKKPLWELRTELCTLMRKEKEWSLSEVIIDAETELENVDITDAAHDGDGAEAAMITAAPATGNDLTTNVAHSTETPFATDTDAALGGDGVVDPTMEVMMLGAEADLRP
jgi:hypothetical protein